MVNYSPNINDTNKVVSSERSQI